MNSHILSAGAPSIVSKMKQFASSNALMIGCVLLFIVLSILFYVYYVSPSLHAKFRPNSEKVSNPSSSTNKAEMLFFYADWCPHCKVAKPIMEDMQAEYENKQINGYTIIFTDVDCSEETEEVTSMMNKYKVEGYPTIKLIKDGQIIEYDAKPSRDTLTKFLETVL